MREVKETPEPTAENLLIGEEFWALSAQSSVLASAGTTLTMTRFVEFLGASWVRSCSLLLWILWAIDASSHLLVVRQVCLASFSIKN